MTFERFEELLKTKYPEATACAHGKFAGTQGGNQVEISFRPYGKCYFYYGSYQSILCRVGISCVYKDDIESMKLRLARLKEEHGKRSLFGLFKEITIDNSREIEEVEQWLKDAEDNKFIII